MENHVRLMANMPNTSDTIETAPARAIQVFQANVRTIEDITKNLQSINELVEADKVTIADKINMSGGRGVGQIRYASPPLLKLFKAKCARISLLLWRPDFNSAPDSVFNEAIRLVFLITFQAAVFQGMYDWVSGLDRASLDDALLLLRLYSHIIDHRFRREYEAQLRNPEQAATARKRNTDGKRRTTVRQMLHLVWGVLIESICHSGRREESNS